MCSQGYARWIRRENVEVMMKALRDNGQVCTRMGAYKPRTSPYSFRDTVRIVCLMFSIWRESMESRLSRWRSPMNPTSMKSTRRLHATGNSTGVMLQIGTRNTQNFELLKIVGRQQDFPVLLKRGFGITLTESLHAAEYLASEGNRKVVFGLRGVKTNIADPHRNFSDFAHVPVVKRLTRMPVCIDPSHAIGSRSAGPEGILDIMHATAQGVIAGANMVLVDFHPEPASALVDGPQALMLSELPQFLEDVQIAHKAYHDREALAVRYRNAQVALT